MRASGPLASRQPVEMRTARFSRDSWKGERVVRARSGRRVGVSGLRDEKWAEEGANLLTPR